MRRCACEGEKCECEGARLGWEVRWVRSVRVQG